jgi:hypothetical protein
MMKLLVAALALLLTGLVRHSWNPLPDFGGGGGGGELQIGYYFGGSPFGYGGGGGGGGIDGLGILMVIFIFIVIPIAALVGLIGGIVGGSDAHCRKKGVWKGVWKGVFGGLGFGILPLLLCGGLLWASEVDDLVPIVLVVHFSLWVWMMIDCLKSNHTTRGKVVWIYVGGCLLLVGPVLYYFYVRNAQGGVNAKRWDGIMRAYVSKDGQQYGPYTVEQLREYVQAR